MGRGVQKCRSPGAGSCLSYATAPSPTSEEDVAMPSSAVDLPLSRPGVMEGGTEGLDTEKIKLFF